MIKNQKDRYKWEFIFLGANIDAAETAKQIGIDEEQLAVSKFNDLLEKANNLSNIEKSKILDTILLEALENKIAAKNAGAFSVAYAANIIFVHNHPS